MTYTNPTDQSPGAVAPAAWANIVNADIRHLRSLLPDAVTPGTVLVASSSTVAGFGQINNIAINDDQINGRTIADDSITAAHIATGAVGTAEIASGSVAVGKLESIDGPSDNEALTYDSATGKFEWQAVPALIAGVPSGLIAAFATAAELTAAGAGWARYTDADGRGLVGAGTAAGETFTENTAVNTATGQWLTNTLGHDPSGSVPLAAVTPTDDAAPSPHTHQISLVFPARAVVWGRKS